ncbi:MAG: hypothetical protein ABEJ86_04585 [Halococcoides sp.]
MTAIHERPAVLTAVAVALLVVGPGVVTASTAPSDAAGIASNTTLEPVVGDRLPTDPNGDGLYEDIDGDGRWTFVDVNTFFQHADRPVITNHTAAYDFEGNGKIDFQDVMALFLERYDGDGDGLTTSEERDRGTDPRLADTDGDTVGDGREVETGTDPMVVNVEAAGVECGGTCTVGNRSIAVGPSDPITAAGPRRTGPRRPPAPDTSYSGPIDPADADIVVAPNGSGDATTIQGGVNLATAGDVIYVRGGIYSGPVRVDESVTIVGPHATIDGSNTARDFHAFNITSNLTIVGVTVADYARAFDQTAPVSSVTIRSVTVRGTEHLVSASGSAADWTIENVSTTGGGMIEAGQSSGDWSLSRVEIDVNGAVNAIWADGSTGDWRLSRVRIALGEASNAVRAPETAGNWTLSNVAIRLGDSSNAVAARGAAGRWRISAVSITAGNASSGINAGGATGSWTLSDLSIDLGTSSNAILAGGGSADWSLSDVSLWVGESGNAIYATGSSGNWTIKRADIGGSPAGSNGIFGVGGSESVRITETAVDVGGWALSVQGGTDRLTVSNVTLSPGSTGYGIAAGAIDERVRLSTVAVDGGGRAVDLGGQADGWIDGLSVTNASAGVTVKSPDSNWTIQNVSVNVTGRPIVVTGARTLRLSNVVARGGSDGIVLESIGHSASVTDAIVETDGRGIVAVGAADWTVENALIRDARYGIDTAGASGSWSISSVSVLNASTVGFNLGAVSGQWTLSDLRVSETPRAIVASGSNGTLAVTESVFRTGETGIVIRDGGGPPLNLSIAHSRFHDFGVGIRAESAGLDRVRATEFRGVDEAINATATTATIDARGNWWGSDGLTETDTAGPVLTGNACDEPCAGDIRIAGVSPGDILPTASLATHEGVAVWHQRVGTTENATITIEYETTALGENASVALIAGPNAVPRIWDLDPSTAGTVTRVLNVDRDDRSADLAGRRVTMILETTNARATVSNVTVG